MDAPGPGPYFLLLFLLLSSAFFSATETAYSCINRLRLRGLAQDGDKRAALALKIADHYDKMLSTILIGNNVVNLSASSIATVLATALVGASGAALSTIVMTILVLTFGEVLPKSYAREHSELIAIKAARLLYAIQVLLTPFSWLFIQLQRLAKPKGGSGEPSVTEQELKSIIQTGEVEGVLDEQESDFLQSVLEFDDTTVQEILIPRVDMIAIDVDDDLAQNLETAVSHGYSRLPVYEDNIDNVIGVVYGKDLLEAFVRGKAIDMRAMVRECIYVYRTKKISDLLAEFKQNKLHMAIVTDEYGGTLGLVTMEDILEELVGEIWDESDVVKQELIQMDGGDYAVLADMNVEDFLEEIGYDCKGFTCEYTTVGGWALERLGHIPTPGESFTYGTLCMTVTKMRGQRISKLYVQRLASVPESAAN